MAITKKIVLLGHFGVGKTSLIRRYVTNEFSSDYKVSIGVHILKKEVTIGNTIVSLIIWDVEGSDDITTINNAYLLGSHAFVVVYDLTRPSTYSKIIHQLEYLKEQHPKTTIKLVGNKIDLADAVATDSPEYTNIMALTHFLTSAKTGENIEPLFRDLAFTLIHG